MEGLGIMLNPLFFVKEKNMIKKIITYEDYNGNKRNDEVYFHLSKAELTEMELSREGGMAAYYERIVKAEDRPTLAAIFKELLLKSYGVKSEDGKGFLKKDAQGNPLSVMFEQTAAFDALYMELITDTDKAVAFFNGIIPKLDDAKLSVVPSEGK